jgi:uncharacterized membrane protein YhaH (DUF805 family)
MDLAPLVRMRWRLRGAWLWPSFVALSILDAAILRARPILGDSISLTGAWLLGLISTLIAIVVFTPPAAALVRRARPDMPRVVARDYAGAQIALCVTLALFLGGLLHHHVVSADKSALADATARAEAYIGAHAANEFQVSLHHLDTMEIEPPSIYRTCAADRTASRYYCVVVNRSKPFGQSVRYDGSEPNGLLSQG